LKLRSVICLALAHGLVDAYAQVVTPLWPRLQREFLLRDLALSLLFAAWQLGTSVSQPLFGYWGDRRDNKRLLGVGPGLAVVCVCAVGFAPGPLALTLLLVAGGLGIGAFHPEAAVAVVESSGTRATTGLALFAFGGMVGLGFGPVLSGALAEKLGLPGLAWGIVPGLIVLGLLAFIRRPAHHHLPIPGDAPTLSALLAGRGMVVTLLLATATLRVIPAVGIPLGLAFVLDRQGRSEVEIGWAQSLFLLSGGIGTLISPLLVRRGREVAMLAGTMLPAALCMALLAMSQGWIFYLGLAGAGLLLQGGIPVLIAYSQRLLPEGRRLAASLTLGASWGLGGLIVAGLRAVVAGRPEQLFWMLIPFTLAAAGVAWLLPRLGPSGESLGHRGQSEPREHNSQAAATELSPT
jgi:FSR family fosmidomycin resistance protein-like MFS transporter